MHTRPFLALCTGTCVLLTHALYALQVLPDNAFDRMHHSPTGEPAGTGDAAELSTFANPVRASVQAHHGALGACLPAC
jgi:hypothetical protein